MLSPDEVPNRKTRTAANERLRQWASQRKNVVVVPLIDFMREATANQAITIHGFSLEDGETRVLLQPDRLHPTRRGCAWLTTSILDAFFAARPGLGSSQVRWDPNAILEKVKSLSTGSAKPAESGPGPKP
jgi:hypothetical protein